MTFALAPAIPVIPRPPIIPVMPRPVIVSRPPVIVNRPPVIIHHYSPPVIVPVHPYMPVYHPWYHPVFVTPTYGSYGHVPVLEWVFLLVLLLSLIGGGVWLAKRDR